MDLVFAHPDDLERVGATCGADGFANGQYDQVAPGETIATTGASGGNEESGLYFELRHLGKAFDPLRWTKPR